MKSSPPLPISLMSMLAALLIFNQFQIASLHKTMVGKSGDPMGTDAPQAGIAAGAPTSQSVDLAAIAKEIMPQGIPAVYGAELEVSFDNAAAAIAVLAPHEQDARPMKLEGKKLERYIKIGHMTSCEFCCGAKTLVFPDGSRACGCAHSAAMRGVVAYLLDTTDMTDEQILAEANKWKARFFPGPTAQKYAAANGLIDTANQTLEQQVGGC
jgi:hypothetical protein